MKTARTLFGIFLLVMVLKLSSPSFAETTTPSRSNPTIPYVATRNDTIRDMLWLADVGKSDIVYDLGSGDGRIVIAAVHDSGARRAVGIENDPNRIKESRKNAQKTGVTDRVKFIQDDLFTSDFSEASVINLFLGHRANIKLRPKIFTILKPGTRIVSHQFGMGEWREDKTLTVRTVYFGMWGTIWSPFKGNPRVPDYTGNELTPYEGDKIFMWVVPAPVAGIWQGEIDTEHGPQELKFILHQRLSEVSGTYELSGQNKLEGRLSIDLWGSNIRFWNNMFYGQKELRFDGQVIENTMSGKVTITEEGATKEYQWKAQRDKVDLTGTWEWPCTTGPRSVKLRIEHDNGKLTASYLDQELVVSAPVLSVPDLYDFGGGFYFTLLIGAQEHGTVITKDTGWLIGEAVLEQGSLTGRIEFYPYGYTPEGTDGTKTTEPVIGDWRPRLIKP